MRLLRDVCVARQLCDTLLIVLTTGLTTLAVQGRGKISREDTTDMRVFMLLFYKYQNARDCPVFCEPVVSVINISWPTPTLTFAHQKRHPWHQWL